MTMTGLQAAILGCLQGLTEFLPVSSSGHLVLGQHLFGLREAELVFDISVHMGTLLAVILYFRKDIAGISGGVIRLIRYYGQRLRSGSGDRSGLSSNDSDELSRALSDDIEARTAVMIVIGSIPTALIGLGLHQFSETIFASTTITGICLLLTAGILTATRMTPSTDRGTLTDQDHPEPSGEPEYDDLSPRRISVSAALIIGLVQGLAVFPGISRSGSTIAVGLFLGLGRDTAARFSFLLSIPAIAGAQILGLSHLSKIEPGPEYLIGPLVAAVTGYAALAFLVYIVKKGRLHYFAPYCLIAGIFALSL